MAVAACAGRSRDGAGSPVTIDLSRGGDPRKVIDEILVRLAAVDPRVLLLTADVGSTYTAFRQRFPDRFIDFGIAEQNMISAAAGFALEGKLPFATTMAAFISMRACEQVRTDVAYQTLNVKLIGFSSGTAYGAQGSTHHATEDMAIMRAFPNMTIISPAGSIEAGKAVEAAAEHPGPVYIRLGRAGDPLVYGSDYDFTIGRAVLLRDGADVAIIATGYMVAKALVAATELERSGVSASVLNVHTIKPLDRAAIIDVARKSGGRVVTVEDHNVVGGLGSAVSEVMAEEHLGPIVRLGVPDVFCVVGSHDEILDACGAGVAGIVEASLRLVGRE